MGKPKASAPFGGRAKQKPAHLPWRSSSAAPERNGARHGDAQAGSGCLHSAWIQERLPRLVF